VLPPSQLRKFAIQEFFVDLDTEDREKPFYHIHLERP